MDIGKIDTLTFLVHTQLQNKIMTLKYVFRTFLIVLLVGFSYGFYQWNKPHKAINAEPITATIDAINLLKEFQKNETSANQKYLDKVIIVKGKVREVKENQSSEMVIILESNDVMSTVSCTVESSQKSAFIKLSKGDIVRIKGLVTGFLEDVVLIKCFLEKL
jgi:hypothetical protein